MTTLTEFPKKNLEWFGAMICFFFVGGHFEDHYNKKKRKKNKLIAFGSSMLVLAVLSLLYLMLLS